MLTYDHYRNAIVAAQMAAAEAAIHALWKIHPDPEAGLANFTRLTCALQALAAEADDSLPGD